MSIDRRTALLDAAIEQIAANGVRGMRIQEVAKSAGVSAALIYHHFGDRATLLQAALLHIGQRADAYTQPADGTAREMLTIVLLDEFQDDAVVQANSAAWGELRDTAIFDPSLRPTIVMLTDRWIDDLARYVELGATDGSINPELDPPTAGAQLTALAEGLSGRWLIGMLTTEQARSSLASGVELLLGPPPSLSGQ